VLPTAGTARFASPLGTEDFVKRSSVIEYSPSGLAAARPHLGTLARIEGLDAHGRAAELRAAEPPPEPRASQIRPPAERPGHAAPATTEEARG
jgi:histidinol dehydrogenase